MKICPYCAEEIKDQAIKCRYCLSMLNNTTNNTELQTKSSSVSDIGIRTVNGNQDFGKLLEYFRERAGFSKVKLAEKLGTSPMYIRQIEVGRSVPPTFEKLEQVGKILDLTEKEIIRLMKSALEKRLSPGDIKILRTIERLER